MIRTNVPRTVEVSAVEALRFACNAVVVERNVVLNTGCGNLKSILLGMGYAVWETDLSEFMKAGGAAKCLTLFLTP